MLQEASFLREFQVLEDSVKMRCWKSWTVKWLRFDNSYFKDIKEKRDGDLLVLPTDAVLFEDPSYKVYAEKYVVDEKVFFDDYAEAHAKLSNIGTKFDPPEPTGVL